MKMFIVLSGLIVALQFAKADTIAKWTFETSNPGGYRAAGAWMTNITAEIGAGTASGLHHSGPAVYGVGSGNGSLFSFGASNSWAVGDFSQFAVSTTGYQNLQISYDQVSSSTGPGTFFLAYSTDGNTFTQIGSDYAVTAGSWSYNTPTSANSFNFDLSSITAINDQLIVYFRVVDDSTVASGGGAVKAVGNDRLDNFLVSAQSVPEPSVMVLTLLGGIFAASVLNRKSFKK